MFASWSGPPNAIASRTRCRARAGRPQRKPVAPSRDNTGPISVATTAPARRSDVAKRALRETKIQRGQVTREREEQRPQREALGSEPAQQARNEQRPDTKREYPPERRLPRIGE